MIAFDSFSKTFGAVTAVDAFSLAVQPGEVVALLGPNGSGKTTCLKAAAGLLQPSKGSVVIGAARLAASSAAARAALAFLPQRVTFPDSLSGFEVLELYRGLRRRPASRIPAVLRQVALDDTAARAVGTYSGGMRQRLGLAVALIAEAPLLLLDEPTAALDQAGMATFYAAAEAQRQSGRTLLFTSHQLADVEALADRVAILVDGRLVADLSRKELVTRVAACGVLRVGVGASSPGLEDDVRRAVPGARFQGREVVISGSPEARAAALEVVRGAGAQISSLAADEGRLEDLYQDLIRKSP
ncbi:MAG: ABC transporter ATP-binding protein [Deltaproteobacteria bacterium]|nr:ABC transporter ATP-binding protein [Deltaproteobacteria bacterium]